MQKVLVLFLLSTVTAYAVAVPPYEPLPSGSRTTQAQNTGATNVSSGNKSSDAGSNSSGLGYKSAVDSSATPASGVGVPSNSNWETYSQMQQMQQELQEVRGMVEELNHQIKLMQKQERERYLDLDLRINKLGGGSESSSIGSGSGPSSKMDDKELYEHASGLRKEGKYDEAIGELNQLLNQSPKGLYAPYAEYWLGELYMVANPADIEKAKRHFINLLAGYPGHVKVPDAMYKLGKLYASQGETGKAKSTLNELVNKYPDKSAAKLAQDTLKTL